MSRGRMVMLLGLMAAAGWTVGPRAWDVVAAEAGTTGAGGPTTVAAVRGGSADVRRLVDEIERRGRALDAREAEIEARAATLEALEQSVADAVARLGGAPAVGAGAGVDACTLRGGVTEIYEQMRPDQAAAILDRLDDQTLRVVFARMETPKIAAIFAEMSRERAVAFTRALAADEPEADPARVRERLARR